MSRQPRVRTRGRRPAAWDAALWLTMLIAIAAVLAIAVLTFPEATGDVWKKIDRAGPPTPTNGGSATAEQLAGPPDVDPTRLGAGSSATSRTRAVELPATITLNGSDAQIPVIPAASPTAVLQPPANSSVIGWWMSGPRSGAPGRVVVAAGSDSPAGFGTGAALNTLVTGDRIQLTGADGRILRYRVTDRRELGPDRLDQSQVVAAAGPDLVVVTCVERFDTAHNSYDSSVVISAGEVDG